MYEQPEPGSRWYYLGKHFTVIGPATRDGEEAVRIRGPRGKYFNVLLRTFARKAGRSGT